VCKYLTWMAMTLLITIVTLTASSGRRPAVTAFTDGWWFVNGEFVRGTRYVSDGRFVDVLAEVDRTIDLGGAFAVPPFGEAHNHNTTPAQLTRYFDEGIFYVKNPDNVPKDRAAVGLINTPSTVDVVYANGGLTSPGGHPISIIDRGIARGAMTEQDGDGVFYYGLADGADLDRRWPGILAQQPDFIKVYLLYSEQFAERRNDPKARGWYGLDPALLPEVVARAHAARLRVSAHVESAFDFALAVDSGVDEINHLPGFRGPAPGMPFDAKMFEISPELARRAAAKDTVVVTTVSGVVELPPALGSMRTAAEALFKTSLRRLHDAGVRIAIGSDRYEFTALDEARYVQSLGVFDNRTLLKMWCETTADTIFPNRNVGRIKTGAEASFLVLDANPLEDFDAVTRIRMRVKQGMIAAANR
jgi:Amidohydrolase family